MASSLVAFMGLTGTGKSSLTNLLLGEHRAKVGHDIQSGESNNSLELNMVPQDFLMASRE